jgi:hypothetical protein
LEDWKKEKHSFIHLFIYSQFAPRKLRKLANGEDDDLLSFDDTSNNLFVLPTARNVPQTRSSRRRVSTDSRTSSASSIDQLQPLETNGIADDFGALRYGAESHLAMQQLQYHHQRQPNLVATTGTTLYRTPLASASLDGASLSNTMDIDSQSPPSSMCSSPAFVTKRPNNSAAGSGAFDPFMMLTAICVEQLECDQRPSPQQPQQQPQQQQQRLSRSSSLSSSLSSPPSTSIPFSASSTSLSASAAANFSLPSFYDLLRSSSTSTLNH